MSKSVLIVDDVELSREILRNAVNGTTDNLIVNTAVNAYDAIDKILINNYDLIIMDIMMPGGDGFELLSMVSEQNIKTKIIIISSLDKSIVSSISMLGKLYSLDIIASLEKPIKVGQIIKLSNDVLSEETINNVVSNGYLETLNNDDYPIVLMYQPQVISDINKTIGFEVLSRWSNIDGSLLPPSFFLPTIEKFGKQKIFTLIVIKQFIKDYHEYFFDTDKSIRFSINVDPNLLLDEELVEYLLGIYDLGIEHRVVIEITEKTLHKASQRELLANALRLRLKGFEISIDDFGVDASNVDRISSMPINEIKIDKKLTWSFSHNTDVMELIEKAKQLAIVKNARVIFEGIENVETKESLEVTGDYLHQGFLYGVPALPSIALGLLEHQQKLTSNETV